MALAILDGTQTATTLSTILSSGQHITAHTVVSLGSQAISDITSAVSSGISVSVSSALPAGTNRIGVVTIGAGTVTIGAGTAQIGSVTASISGTVPVSGTFYQTTQPVSLASLPSLVAGTSQIGSVTASISGTIPVSISSVTIGNSITISSLPSLVAGTAQIGSVTASIIGTVPVSGTFYQATQPVSLATLPSLVASTAQIGSVTASISGTIPVSISSVTIGNSLTIGSIVTHGVTIANTSVTVNGTFYQATQPVSIASVTIGGGTVTIGAGTAQIGSVTASLAYSQTATTISSTAVTAIPVVLPTSGAYGGSLQGYNGTNTYIYSGIQAIGSTSLASATSLPVSLVSLPALAAGTAQIGSVTIGNSVTIGSLPAISGTVTANTGFTQPLTDTQLRATSVPVSFASNPTVYVTQPSAYSRLGVQLVDSSGTGNYGTTGTPLKVSGTVTLGAGTTQIGSVTASISGGVVANVTEAMFAGGNGDTVDFGVQIGFFDSLVSEFVKVNSSTNRLPTNTFAVQGTSVTTSNFTSTTPSTVLANFNSGREVLTIFNEGAGNLHLCAGATCTTIAYQVRLSAGDYYEVPNHQTTITHSAVFATAGTARVTQVS
jgi:hypothetical protein